MKLTLHEIPIKNVEFGENQILEGTLTIDQKALTDYITQDTRIKSVEINLAKPGDSCRIIPVKDIIEPRYKEEGDIFPGSLNKEVVKAGEGITYCLKGCSIVTTGPIVGFQEGLIDMSGPGAEYSPFGKLNNIVLSIIKQDNIDPHEHEEVIRLAGLRAAEWVGKIAKGYSGKKEEKIFNWPTLSDRVAAYPELPKVMYICNCMAQGLLHDTYFYGQDLKHVTPISISPNEIFDGALVSGNCVSPGSKTTTYHHLNNAVIESLWKHHGKEINFIGILINPLMVTLKEKKRNIMLSVKATVDEYNCDAAIISQEGFGNPTTDLMHTCKALENAGVKTVIITNEDAGTDGMSESLPDVVSEANAIVTTGNSNATVLLPKMDKVIGVLEEVEKITGGNSYSIQEDGSLLIEIHGIMGSHNLHGNTYLSAKTI